MKSLLQKVSTTSIAEAFRKVAGLGGSRISRSVALGLGVMVGLLPIVPFQTPVVILLAFLFRVNRVAAFAGTLVCQPFTIPFLWGGEYALGCWLTNTTSVAFAEVPKTAASILALGRIVFTPMAAGSAVVAVAGGLLTGFVAWYIFGDSNRQKGDSSVVTREGRP